MGRNVVMLVLLGVALRLPCQEPVVSLETPFTRLKVSGNIHLELVPSDSQRLIFLSEADRDATDLELGEGTLALKTRTELSMEEAVSARLHYISLAGFEIVKGGRVQSADTLRAQFLELYVATGGKIELHIRVDSLHAKVNQGADIILYGHTGFQSVDAYSWGNYLAYDLESVDAYVKAATGAQVKVNVEEVLEANATSGGFIGYMGVSNQKKFKTSLGGEITRMSE